MTAPRTTPRWSDPVRVREGEDGPPRRGIGDLVATILIVLDLDTVRRSTIRSLLPAENVHHETGEPVKSTVDHAMRRALKRFRLCGWIEREDPYIHVKDRQGLASWIGQAVDASEERAAIMLGVEQAATEINARIEAGTAISSWDAEQVRRYAEIRRRELEAIDRLMRQAHTAGAGVRLIHKGGLL